MTVKKENGTSAVVLVSPVLLLVLVGGEDSYLKMWEHPSSSIQEAGRVGAVYMIPHIILHTQKKYLPPNFLLLSSPAENNFDSPSSCSYSTNQ